MSDAQGAKAAKQMHIAMRTRRPLSAYPRDENAGEIFLDLITTTAVWCGGVSEEDAIRIFRDCLRWVRGDDVVEPKPPSSLN